MAYGQLGAVFQHLRRLLGTQEAADLTDAQLLARFSASRDETAFAALLQRHGPLVLNVCRRVLGNVHDADDAFQAVFLVLARKADSIRRKESLGSWLYGVAYRIASRAKANAARRRSLERQAETMSPATADHQAAWEELQPILDEELSRLPEKYRVSIVLRYLQGKSNEQAAREAGCPAGTMSWRLAHGLDLLRQRLDRRGVAIPAASGLAILLTDRAASAALSPSLAAGTLQAAVGFAAGQTAGVSLSILALAEGALKAMFLTKLKLTLVLLLAVGLAGIGAGWVSWNLLGQGTPTALAVPLPEPKPAPPRNPEDKAVSEPVIANEAAFRLETDAVWWLPPVDGKRAIPLALRIENQSKETRQFIRWRGDVVLLAADGTPLEHSEDSARIARRVFETDALEQGKQLTAAEPVRLDRDGNKALRLTWMDIADTRSYFRGLKPGKYRVALQYTMRAGAANQWSGDVTTKPVEIEIREAPAQAVDGLELMLTADKTETVLKGDGSNIEPIVLKLTLTNVGGKPLKLNTYPLTTWSHTGNFLRVIGPDGQELKQAAIPPAPAAPPFPPRAEQIPLLQPGSSWQHTIRFPTGSYRLQTAGEYRIRASFQGTEATTPHPSPAFAQGSWTGKLDSNEVELKVKRAGNAAAGNEVNGLKLSLSADKTETVMKADGSNAEPVKLSLTFTNVSDKPLKLDAYDFVWRHLQMKLTGPDAQSIEVTRKLVDWKKVAPTAAHFPTLQPQQQWTAAACVTLPGEVAIVDPKVDPGTYYQQFVFRKPGQYRVQLTYTCAEVWNHPLAKETWTGSLTSNEVVLTMKLAK
jgi:RNA polymerase sigma factor (sigma-70 family)